MVDWRLGEVSTKRQHLFVLWLVHRGVVKRVGDLAGLYAGESIRRDAEQLVAERFVHDERGWLELTARGKDALGELTSADIRRSSRSRASWTKHGAGDEGAVLVAEGDEESLTRIPAILFEPKYWQARLHTSMEAKSKLLIFPRPDLSGPLVEVTELSMRAHDGIRLWGLRAESRFLNDPQSIQLREVSATDVPIVRLDPAKGEAAEFVLQVPAGRRLQDRVLDVLRFIKLAADSLDVEPSNVECVASDSYSSPGTLSDECIIAQHLIGRGIYKLLEPPG